MAQMEKINLRAFPQRRIFRIRTRSVVFPLLLTFSQYSAGCQTYNIWKKRALQTSQPHPPCWPPPTLSLCQPILLHFIQWPLVGWLQFSVIIWLHRERIEYQKFPFPELKFFFYVELAWIFFGNYWLHREHYLRRRTSNINQHWGILVVTISVIIKPCKNNVSSKGT